MLHGELARVSRLYSVLSQINHSLVSANSRDALLYDICEATARLGGFQIVWVGHIEPNTKRVIPIARAGERQQFLDEVTIRADEGPIGQCPTGTCARTGQLTILTDLAHDPRTTALHVQYAKYNLQAVLAVPLLLSGAHWGVFVVYDENEQAFGDLETGLLQQVANDISFALDYMEKEVERERALVELQENRNRLELLIEHVPAGLAMFDTEMRYLAASRRWKMDYGLGDTDVVGKSHYELFPEVPERWKSVHRRVFAGEAVQAECDRFERLDGTVQYVRWDARPWLTKVAGVEQIGGLVIFAEDITQSECTAQALRESEARYRLVSENGSDVIWLFELASNRFVYVSPSVEKLRGFSVAEVLKQGMDEALTPESLDLVTQNLPGRISAFAAGDESAMIQMHEVDQSCKGGHVVATEVVTTLIADNQRRVTHIQGVSRNITQRKVVERALRESKAKLDAALASMMDAVFISDLNGHLIDFNEAFANFHKFSHKGECPTTLAEYRELLEVCLGDGTVAPLDQWAVPRAIRGEVSTNTEYRLRRKDTGESWFGSFSFAPIRDVNGTIVGSVVVGRDITQQKIAEQLHIEHANRLSAALEVSPVPMALLDREGTFHFLNTAFVRTFGYEPSEVPTLKHWRARAYPDPDYSEHVLRAWKTELGRVKNDGGTFHPIEIKVVCRDGSVRTTLASSGMLPHSVDGMVVAVFFDITELKRAELTRAKLEAQLQQAQKMESVGRLAGGVAHDFNNMLGAILGHLEFAREQIAPESPVLDDLAEVRRAAERSAELTKQLLAFARKQTVSPKVLDLNQTVAGMLRMLQRLIGENIDLEWRPSARLWSIRTDPSQVDQILANLCINARDAISDVGKITIETRNRTFDAEYCATHAGYVPGDYVLLAVSDDGCGMDQETQSHLFEPFFTTKGVGKGTGLGLATVYGIVTQNNGVVNVYSEPGQGTTFRIYLPRCADSITQSRPPNALATEGGDETILVVEDEAAILALTTRILKRLGYEVLPASSPSMALDVVQRQSGPIHLLVTDVVMPEMNGRDLAMRLRALYPAMRQLYMSGYTANVIAHRGVLGGGEQFLQKPFSRRELAEAVRRTLDA